MIRKMLPLLLLSAAVAAAAGAATGGLMARAHPPADASGAGALDRLSAELARVTARQEALERSLAEAGAAAELVAPSGSRVSQGDIEAAVERWMLANPPGPSREDAGLAAESAPLPTEERVHAALARLAAQGLSETERQALWREFSEQGLLDELVAAFEARAAAAPGDPDAHMAVAAAYLNKIFEVGNGPEAGLWATKADQAFDRALELDETHWDARFSKAVSLSFWPPVFGKQGEAIRHFEILVDQQARRPAEERYAQTHLLLGNMYRQIGEVEQAEAAWKLGLESFPDDEDLLEQLQVYSKAQ